MLYQSDPACLENNKYMFVVYLQRSTIMSLGKGSTVFGVEEGLFFFWRREFIFEGDSHRGNRVG